MLDRLAFGPSLLSLFFFFFVFCFSLPSGLLFLAHNIGGGTDRLFDVSALGEAMLPMFNTHTI